MDQISQHNNDYIQTVVGQYEIIKKENARLSEMLKSQMKVFEENQQAEKLQTIKMKEENQKLQQILRNQQYQLAFLEENLLKKEYELKELQAVNNKEHQRLQSLEQYNQSLNNTLQTAQNSQNKVMETELENFNKLQDDLRGKIALLEQENQELKQQNENLKLSEQQLRQDNTILTKQIEDSLRQRKSSVHSVHSHDPASKNRSPNVSQTNNNSGSYLSKSQPEAQSNNLQQGYISNQDLIQNNVEMNMKNNNSNRNHLAAMSGKENLSVQQNILNELCQIFNVDNENNLIICARKVELVVQVIPKLESLVKQVCSIVLQGQASIEQLLPTLQSWSQERAFVQELMMMRQKLIGYLELPAKSALDKDILRAVATLKQDLILTQERLKEDQFKGLPYQQFKELFCNKFQLDDSDNLNQQISLIAQQRQDFHQFTQICRNIMNASDEEDIQQLLTKVINVLENNIYTSKLSNK